MTEDELSAFEVNIIVTCEKHKQDCQQTKDSCLFVSDLAGKPTTYFIKFDHPSGTLWSEFCTQSYIYDYAVSHNGAGNGAPRIPRVYHYFESRNQSRAAIAFLVM